MTTEYEVGLVRHGTWAPPRPDDEAFCALVEREVLEARRRAYESLGVDPAAEPAPVRRRGRPPGPRWATVWPRWRLIAAIWRHEIEFGSPVRSAQWTHRSDEWPSVSDVVREFGSWTAGMVAAGYPESVEERLGY